MKINITLIKTSGPLGIVCVEQDVGILLILYSDATKFHCFRHKVLLLMTIQLGNYMHIDDSTLKRIYMYASAVKNIPAQKIVFPSDFSLHVNARLEIE